MPGKVTITVKGLKEVDRALRQIGPELAEQAGDSALRAMAKPIIDEAKRLAPVRTGAYRDAIVFTLDKRRGSDSDRIGHIGLRSPFSRLAHLLEFGTAHSAARPHLRPALDGQSEAAIKAGGVALARNLKSVVNKLATGKKVRGVR